MNNISSRGLDVDVTKTCTSLNRAGPLCTSLMFSKQDTHIVLPKVTLPLSVCLNHHLWWLRLADSHQPWTNTGQSLWVDSCSGQAFFEGKNPAPPPPSWPCDSQDYNWSNVQSKGQRHTSIRLVKEWQQTHTSINRVHSFP